MKVLLIILGILLIPLTCAPVHACSLSWKAVDTYDNGSPVTGPVTYKVYKKAPGSMSTQVIGQTTDTKMVIDCQSGEYYATALQPNMQESVASNKIILKEIRGYVDGIIVEDSGLPEAPFSGQPIQRSPSQRKY